MVSRIRPKAIPPVTDSFLAFNRPTDDDAGFAHWYAKQHSNININTPQKEFTDEAQPPEGLPKPSTTIEDLLVLGEAGRDARSDRQQGLRYYSDIRPQRRLKSFSERQYVFDFMIFDTPRRNPHH